MHGDIDADDDERAIELSSIAAIFPELVIDSKDPFSASLELAVSPAEPLPVAFPLLTSTASATALQAVDTPKDLSASGITIPPPSEVKYISHLPPLRISITLPQGYPSTVPPEIYLSSSVPWIPETRLTALEGEAVALWNDLGKNQVIYDYLDLLQQSAEDAFGLAPSNGEPLTMPTGAEVVLLDYDLKAKRRKFEESTFDCGVCLEPKKGAVCYKLQECCHVFCVECLQSFYNNCITEGDVYSVKCLAPDCENKLESESAAQRMVKTLEASELIQIPLEQDQVQRYVKLLKKKRLESDKNTVYCPRKWCQGPARSSHQPSNDKDNHAIGSDDKSSANESAKKKKLPPPAERLCVCLDCGFAFCLVCKGGWHGEFAPCFPRSQYELTAEEMASKEYLRKHSQVCPTCHARCQKTMGCNHMECFQCKTHFCYLCRAFLDRENPYKHFNTPHLPCYMKLWVLEEGDGEPDGGQPPARPDAPQVDGALDDDDDDDDDIVEVVEVWEPPPPAPVPPNRNENHPNIRFNRRARQGLARHGGRLDNNFNGLQRFLAMAAADEEDGWDSDELDDLDDI